MINNALKEAYVDWRNSMQEFIEDANRIDEFDDCDSEDFSRFADLDDWIETEDMYALEKWYQESYK